MTRLPKTEIFLHPGEFFFGDSGELVGTILGSCVAVVIWHPYLHCGGMCHFVLPASQSKNGESYDVRYADGAMARFCKEIDRRNTSFRDYHIKIFGGANTVPELTELGERTIGDRNVDTVIDLLTEKGGEIKATDVGKSGFRRILFDVNTGDVWVKRHAADLRITQDPSWIDGITI